MVGHDRDERGDEATEGEHQLGDPPLRCRQDRLDEDTGRRHAQDDQDRQQGAVLDLRRRDGVGESHFVTPSSVDVWRKRGSHLLKANETGLLADACVLMGTGSVRPLRHSVCWTAGLITSISGLG